MCELQFKRVYRYRKGKVRSKGEEEFKPKIVKVPNKRTIMAYHHWTDEICINEYFACEELDKRYPFHSQMLEDDTAAILTHEALHQVLRNTAGWTAASYLDRVCPYWAMKYWMNPPGVD